MVTVVSSHFLQNGEQVLTPVVGMHIKCGHMGVDELDKAFTATNAVAELL
jgi:hypothetical protein